MLRALEVSTRHSEPFGENESCYLLGLVWESCAAFDLAVVHIVSDVLRVV